MHLRIAPALVFCFGLLMQLWAADSFAALAGTASAAPGDAPPAAPNEKGPSIRLSAEQSGLAGSCGGAGFDVNTNINVGSQASSDVKLSAEGVGVVEEFTDETGKNIGPYSAPFPTFHIPAFGGGLAPNTVLTLTITTYSGPTLTGSVTSVSTITFNCTTGKVLSAPLPGFSTAVPALSSMSVVALVALLALLGAAYARRPARRRVSRDPPRR
jgi:hypothetical protein